MSEATHRRLFLIFLGALLCAVLALNLLTPFAADDYFYAFSFATGERIVSLRQLIPSLIAHGQIMNGRYAPHFFVQLFTMLPDFVFEFLD